jgi:hypothetical protein
MPKKKGWVSIHRSIYDNWIWNDDEEFDKRSAWIDLLLMVNHEDKKVLIDGNLELVKRGQRITSIRKLCSRWKWSRTKVNNFLKLLEKDKMISLEIEPHKKTVITIVNYSLYQDDKASKRASEEPVKDQIKASEEPVKSLNNNERIMTNNDNDNYYVRNSEDKLYLKTFAECGGSCSKYNFYRLRDLEKEYGEEQLIKAIETSADNNKVTTAYIKGILNNWNKKEVVDGYEDLNIIKL